MFAPRPKLTRNEKLRQRNAVRRNGDQAVWTSKSEDAQDAVSQVNVRIVCGKDQLLYCDFKVIFIFERSCLHLTLNLF